jgi:adenylate cyclase
MLNNNIKNLIINSRIIIFLFALGVSLFFFGLLGKMETSEMLSNTWQDFLYSTRDKTGNDIKDVVIVAVDEPSFKQIGQKWPWSRRLHAELVNNLSRAGAKAIVFDMLFPEPSANSEDDQLFATAIRNAGNVALGIFSSQTQRREYVQSIIVEPITPLKEAAAITGYVNHFPDNDGIVRYGYKLLDNIPSLAYAGCMTAFPGDAVCNACIENTFLIDFEPDISRIPVISYYQVLNNYASEETFKDKIVFVGLGSDIKVDAQGAVDAFPTPFFRFKKEMMYGVAVHANALITLLNGCRLQMVHTPILFLLFFSISLFPFWVRKKPMVLMMVGGGSISALMMFSMALFNFKGMIIDIMPAVFAISSNTLFLGLNEFRKSHKERRYIKQAFESYVSSDIVKIVLDNPSALALGGEKKEMTVMFADINGFTTVSEALEPEQLVSVLNNYFQGITNVILKNKGTLDKYIGDAVMAFFGAPVHFDDHAQKACATSLSLDSKLNNPEGTPELVFRGVTVGINSGHMVVGNIGSEKRFDYTVIGDAVNLASRFEALNKTYNTNIIIGENTKKQLDTTLFLTRELDFVRVKGKHQAVSIYELLENNEEKRGKIVIPFAIGLEAYRNKNWKYAETIFYSILKNIPSDGPAKVFQDRCRFFAENSPSEDWDMIWEMKTK